MCILKYDAIKDARRVKITRRFKKFSFVTSESC